LEISEVEERWERKHRREVLSGWKNEAQGLRDADDGKRKRLQREARREALVRLEDAARTIEEFQDVIIIWDYLAKNRAETIAKHEKGRPEDLLEWDAPCETVIPQPIDHVWWREITGGSFLDMIFDCPHEIHELTSSRPVSFFTRALDENRKEILYLRAIRLWSPQRIAVLRGQTDRNIRKIYSSMIEDIRLKLFKRLYPRFKEGLPLTLNQKNLVAECIEKYGEEKAYEKDEDDEAEDGVLDEIEEELNDTSEEDMVDADEEK